MRKVGTKVIGILLMMSLLLAGCGGWKNYVHTEASLKNEAANALKDKYDEEFVIYEV